MSASQHTTEPLRHFAPKLTTWLNRTVDVGIGCVLLAAPLAMGGRYPTGRLILAVIVGITTIAWLLARAISPKEKRYWVWTSAEWFGLFSVILLMLQLAPWPTSILEHLSPSLDQVTAVHSLTNESSTPVAPSLQRWNQVSLAPQETRNGLAICLIYLMFFFMVVHRIQSKGDVKWALRMLALAGVSMAAIGIAQYLLNNGKFLWFMEHPSRDTTTVVKGTFANENHFMHFLALSIGPLIWWLVDELSLPRREDRAFQFGGSHSRISLPGKQVLLCLGLGLVVLASLLSTSRGGLAMLFLATLVTTVLLGLQGKISKRVIGGVTAAMLLAGVASWFHGQEILLREVASLGEGNIESLDQGHGRRKIWKAVTTAAPDFAILGSGIGSHRYVYHRYMEDKSHVQYTHAESGYLHMLLEAGGPGLALLLVGISFCGYWIYAAARSDDEVLRLLAIPLAASWFVSITHAIFDFNWFIPANMCLTLIVVALAVRVWLLSEEDEPPYRISIPTNGWWAMAVVAVAATWISVSQLVGPAIADGAWQEYRAWSLASKRFEAKSIGPGRQRHLGPVDLSEPDTVSRMITLLQECVRSNPEYGRAHIRLAGLYLRQFEQLQSVSDNPMSLGQIRDAALASEFESRDALREWVKLATGENYVCLQLALNHALDGLRSIPTEGNGYLYLSEVAFLDDSVADREFELLQQAYRVRPQSSAIQFAYGRQLILAGQREPAMALWQRAFRNSRGIRKRIIEAVAVQSSPQEILGVFAPDAHGMRDLFEYYRHQNMRNQMTVVGHEYVTHLVAQAQLMTGNTASKMWLDITYAHEQMGDLQAAADAAEQAVLAEPYAYQNRFVCACRMRDAGRLSRAIEEFQWCEDRRPNAPELAGVLPKLRQQVRQLQLRNAQVNVPGYGSR